MAAPIRPLDAQDVAFIQRKLMYALDMAVEGGEPDAALLHVVEKCGPLLGMSSVDVEVREAKLRVRRDG